MTKWRCGDFTSGVLIALIAAGLQPFHNIISGGTEQLPQISHDVPSVASASKREPHPLPALRSTDTEGGGGGTAGGGGLEQKPHGTLTPPTGASEPGECLWQCGLCFLSPRDETQPLRLGRPTYQMTWNAAQLSDAAAGSLKNWRMAAWLPNSSRRVGSIWKASFPRRCLGLEHGLETSSSLQAWYSFLCCFFCFFEPPSNLIVKNLTHQRSLERGKVFLCIKKVKRETGAGVQSDFACLRELGIIKLLSLVSGGGGEEEGGKKSEIIF